MPQDRQRNDGKGGANIEITIYIKIRNREDVEDLVDFLIQLEDRTEKIFRARSKGKIQIQISGAIAV
jgi:hypothetical protein